MERLHCHPKEERSQSAGVHRRRPHRARPETASQCRPRRRRYCCLSFSISAFLSFRRVASRFYSFV